MRHGDMVVYPTFEVRLESDMQEARAWRPSHGSEQRAIESPFA